MTDDPDTPRVDPTDGASVTELRLVLTVDDHAAAVTFYRDALGLAQLEQYDERGGHVTILDAGRATLEVNDAAYAEYIDEVEIGRRVPGQVRVAFQVPDSGEATDRLVGAGAQLIAPPTRTPWGSRNSRLRAPDGVQLTLFTELAASTGPA